MTNPTGTQWETALLNKLTSNGERIALIEQDLKIIKADTQQIKEKLFSTETRLTEAEEILVTVKTILKITKWIGGGVAAIALSLMANFIYLISNLIISSLI